MNTKVAPQTTHNTELLELLHGDFNSGRLHLAEPDVAEQYSKLVNRSMAFQKDHSDTWLETENGVALVALMLAMARWWASEPMRGAGRSSVAGAGGFGLNVRQVQEA